METGVYNISDGVSETRSANARYFLPASMSGTRRPTTIPDGGVYYDYPTGRDTVPTPVAGGTEASRQYGTSLTWSVRRPTSR